MSPNHRLRLRAQVDRKWEQQFDETQAAALAEVASDFRAIAEASVDAPLHELRNLVEEVRMLAVGSLGRPACEGPGCFGCCLGPVPVLRRELEAIREVAPPEVFERARALAELDDDDPRLMTAPCPALDPRWKTCTVYAERPIVCRSHASWADPRHCGPGKSGASTTALIVGSLAEIMRAHGPGEVVLLLDGLAEDVEDESWTEG